MFLLFGAFIAGLLTVVAPCVLPLLPIIIGGSVSGDTTDKKRPLIIAASLAISLIVFTLLLKATSLLIDIPPQFITYFSGSIIIILGILTLFPLFYAKIMARIGFERYSQQLLGKGFKNKDSITGPIITGAALGPVFSSCSPVYAYILATILPGNFAQALVYITAYVLGLGSILLIIGIYGQRIVRKIKFASNPKGWFQRTVAILFIATGLLIFTGNSLKVQTWVSNHTPFNFNALSEKLLPKNKASVKKDGNLNIQPYPAPEFTGISAWINSEPLTIAQLRGKVVLVDFWTYSCINCIRNNVYLEKWYEKYKDQGFVIVGLSAPEFSFEKVLSNVKQGAKDQHLTYPIALDNDLATWNAYRNQYWPAGYLIDANGNIRRTEFGEGGYQESEDAIRTLLAEKGASLQDAPLISGDVYVPITAQQTHETYLGVDRASNFSGKPYLGDSPTATYTPTSQSNLTVGTWTLGGAWEVGNQTIIARGNSSLTFRVSSKDVFLVMGSPTPAEITITLDSKPIGSTDSSGPDVKGNSVTVSDARLYRLISHPNFTSDSTFTLSVPNGVELNAFTFGS
jgi:cytochrome c biogenesis protein CcdA/thiol-disulfide isomerase/thioredoxin